MAFMAIIIEVVQPQINRYKRRDYTGAVKPRTHHHTSSHVTEFVSRPKPSLKHQTVSNHQAVVAQPDETVTLSIKINLPDYNSWKITTFGRQYPYLLLALVAAGVVCLLLLLQALGFLWHTAHNHPLPAALMHTLSRRF
jgi:hypothetical protein